MRTFWVTTDSKYWASLVAVFAFFAAPADAQEDAFFNLSSQGFVLPGQIPSVEFSGRGVTKVDFRIYRIPDPEAFFLAQANIRSPRPVSLGTPVTESASMKQSLREIQKQTARGYRDLTRAVVSSELRSYLTEPSSSEEEPLVDAPAQEVSVDDEPVKPPILSNYPLIREIAHFLKEEERPGWWNHQSIPLFASPPDVGVYLVEAVAVGKRAYTVSIVTNLRYVAKQGSSHSDSLVVFVASADSGSPVPAAKVIAFDEEDSKEAGLDASTNNEGVALLPAVRGSQTLMVLRDDDFLLGDAYFYFAAEDWDSEAPASGRQGRVYIYTDRPVYRPGHQVFFKALLRSLDTQGRYTLARSDIVQVTAMDPMNRSIYSTESTANDLGSIEGDLPLSGEPALGTYTLKIDWADRSYYGHFRVEEYKKPEFEVTVSTDEPNYIAGDRMGITFNATYYFGDPVAGGKLEYEVYHADYWRPWWEDLELDWYFAGDGGYHTYNYELLQQGDGVLDRQGRFMVEVPTEGRSHDAVFRIVARISDQTNREISGSKIVPVAAGTYSIEVSSDRYATATGDPMAFSLRTQTIEGDPVSEELELKVIRRTWEEGRSQEETVRTVAVSTDDSGAATFEFAPREPGSYQLDVQGEDERGNRMRSEYGFWVWSDRPWWAEARGGGLTLTPDRKTYKSSETAQLLLISPVENPTVLFTVEGPTLFEHRVLQISGTTASIPLALEERFSPNVYVSATVISGGRFYEKNDLLVIPPRDRFLNISIDTDRPTYMPGEEVELEVTVENEQGQPVDAEVSIGVVDLAIYAIAPDSTPDIRTYFYGKRPNEVRTNLSTGYYMYSSAREALVSEPEEELAWADFKTVAETKIRKTFKDTMFWQAVVRTGPTGTVKVPVETPDNLTTWRITVRATDLDTRVGQKTATFITRKNIMVRLGLPRFFRNRDSGAVTATVHNSQETPADVRVRMEAEGIQLDSPLERTLHLEEQSSQTLTWDYSSQKPGRARFTVYALSEGKSDAEERQIPILPHGLEITETANAVITAPEDDRRLSMTLPETGIPDNLFVELSLSPSLAGPVLKSLDYLIGYPYGCVEQTISQFLPTVLVTHTLQDLGIEAPPLVGKLKEIPQMVDKGLSRLYNHQHGDGGWGWWEYDGSDPFMTGYVMYGLARAKEAGFGVDEVVIQRGMSAATGQLQNPDLDISTRLYLLYVFSVAGSSDRTMIEKLYQRRQEMADELTPMSRAHMILTLHRQGFENEALVALNELLQTSERASGYVYWEGPEGGGLHWRNDSLLTSAAALEAMLAVNPEHEDAVGVVRYLMSRRQGPGRWRSTLDTAQIVYALMAYMNAQRELFADFDVEVTAGGKSLLEHHFSRDDLFAEPMRIPIPAEVMADSREIEIRKQGRGNLYATLTWRYFSREEDLPPTQAGPLSIRRKYYRLNLEKKADGSYTYRRTLLDQRATVKPGDLVLVTLLPRAAEDTEYLMIEDMLPSGFEVIEDIRGWRIDGIPYQEYSYYGWDYWYSHREVRDERVAFFSRYFGRGSENYLYYVVRAQTPGDYHIMPARIELMYYPESRGTSAEMRLRVGK